MSIEIKNVLYLLPNEELTTADGTIIVEGYHFRSDLFAVTEGNLRHYLSESELKDRLGISVRDIVVPEQIEAERIEITVYDEKWYAFIPDGAERRAADSDDFDDDGVLLPSLTDEGYVQAEDDLGNVFLCYYDELLFKAIPTGALRSGWGYQCPSAGFGLEDAGRPEKYTEIDDEIVYLVQA